MPLLLNGGLLPDAMRGAALPGIVGIWDFYSTFLALAGLPRDDPNPHAPAAVDGVDVSGYIFGASKASPRTELVYDHLMYTRNTSACIYNGLVQVAPCMGGGAIRVGEHKLLVGEHGWAQHFGHFSPNASWDKSMEKATLCSMERPCLFDVEKDMEEQNDLSDQLPDVVASMLKRFHAYDSEYHPPTDAPPVDTQGLCDAALNNGGFLTPWVS